MHKTSIAYIPRYHHPWLSTLTGIMANISTLTLILLISWAKFTTAATQKIEPRSERKESESSEEEVIKY